MTALVRLSKKWSAVFLAVLLLIVIPLDIRSHSVWTQRNEPGSWTIALYHCDDEEIEEGSFVLSADGNESLHLVIGSASEDSMGYSDNVKHNFLLRSLIGYSEQHCIASGEITHPTGDLSIEFWLRFIERGADLEIGLLEGVTFRIRIGDEGDRFQLMGANVTDVDIMDYCAPGFESFPPVGSWHHYGVTLHAPNVELTETGNYRYGDGCYARFYYDSHVVGFVDQTKQDLTGLEFAPFVKPAILIHHGTMSFDEVMVSDVDWSDPVGHEGSGHGGISVEHAFENGRQPVAVSNWDLF